MELASSNTSALTSAELSWEGSALRGANGNHQGAGGDGRHREDRESHAHDESCAQRLAH